MIIKPCQANTRKASFQNEQNNNLVKTHLSNVSSKTYALFDSRKIT